MTIKEDLFMSGGLMNLKKKQKKGGVNGENN
jgi:hypothetical protein